MDTSNAPDADSQLADLRDALGGRSVVLVGMMGVGKSSVGRRLAARLQIPFVDADAEIEAAAGQTIADMFETHGEAYFRDGEKRVIARLLQSGPQVLATGGGAYMDETIRNDIAQNGISVWLNAAFDVLMRRVRKRSTRPLLKTADPEGTMRDLLAKRNPVYAMADLQIKSRDVPHDVVVQEIIAALDAKLIDDAGARSSTDQ